MNYSLDTTWTTMDGIHIKVRDLEDTHLANIIKHLHHYKINYELMIFLTRIAFERGLKEDFLYRALIPYKNENGDWMLWSFEKDEPVKVG